MISIAYDEPVYMVSNTSPFLIYDIRITYISIRTHLFITKPERSCMLPNGRPFRIYQDISSSEASLLFLN